MNVVTAPASSLSDVPRRKVLWAALMAPYGAVAHAGGQTAFHYITSLASSTALDLSVFAFCEPREVTMLDLSEHGVDASYAVYETGLIARLVRGVANLESRLNPFNRYAGILSNHQVLMLKRHLRKLIGTGRAPDVVVLQWTQMALLAPWVRRVLPSCRIVCVEEDVTFARLEREAKLAESPAKRAIGRWRFRRLRSIELRALAHADWVTVNNDKDHALLCGSGVPRARILRVSPYYTDLSAIDDANSEGGALFFGAMARPENHDAVMWFVDRVLRAPLGGLPVGLTVLGAGPRAGLVARAGDDLRVVGYQRDIRPFFENALCFVAPLRLGAGIKVKVLEAMSAGLPVLTTPVGIEGIPAVAGRDYLPCETPEDFREAILRLLDDSDLRRQLGRNARRCVHDHFDREQSVQTLLNALLER